MKRYLDDIRNRVRLMVGRAVLTVIDDARAIQVAQAALLAGEKHDGVERIQEYGFSSVPLSGAEGVVIFVGGLRDHGLIIATDDRRYRPAGLAAGEVIIYDDQGQKIHITRNGIVLDGGGKQITLTNTPMVRAETVAFECTGEVKDHCDGTGKTMLEMRTIYNGHHHGPSPVPTEQM